ncbi:GNAT family N-acetyltransferase [Fusobacterium sp. MFO224]|uniref:GNAT family N-acetyltransferase n=1 Tax=Fusobacterium sp. MFO224 TaxID=3378070 RepID=UPI0038523D34
MDIKIRQVKPSDLDEITKIENICFPEAEAATRDSFKYRIATFPKSFYVALDNEKIVGFINGAVTNHNTIVDELYEPEGGHNPEGKNQSIFGLDVLPEYQRQGIAEKLMKYMMEKSREAKREKMILTCKERLIHYYEKFGYENKGISESVHGGVVWYDMEAKL